MENEVQETEVKEEEVKTEEPVVNELVEEPKAEEKVVAKPKPKAKSPAKTKKKTTTVVEEEIEDSGPEPVEKTKPVVPNGLELENRILRKALETGFDADALQAFVTKDIQVSVDGTDNLDTLVSQYVEKYPTLVKSAINQPKTTPAIAPTNVITKEQKEVQMRAKFFGNQNNFFNGSGVRI